MNLKVAATESNATIEPYISGARRSNPSRSQHIERRFSAKEKSAADADVLTSARIRRSRHLTIRARSDGSTLSVARRFDRNGTTLRRCLATSNPAFCPKGATPGLLTALSPIDGTILAVWKSRVKGFNAWWCSLVRAFLRSALPVSRQKIPCSLNYFPC